MQETSDAVTNNSFSDVGIASMQHLEQIFAGFQIKAALASVSALFVSALGGDWYIFELWFIMNAIDLFCGVLLAVKVNRFARRRVYGWVVKTFTHVLTIILVGLVSYVFSLVSGYPVPVLDWFMFVLLLTEVASIIDSLVKMGLPVPPLARKIVTKIRRKSEAKLDELTSGETPYEEKE